ncbi:hypothetical protein GBA65_00830 [Rubrobacter marinus]|uniref:Gram-positive cocci surface proteins LPxTG domain-containing protein n=1 Tax=Rubrobacter marinus TaxID=2653852 RepID=A0A6G8PTK7_9ACTN|nr:hypothetical protein [Rubrobacter marinus]QIN77296.1 hypothetical protein GBA65_00830 [Rubrobacter marinus]
MAKRLAALVAALALMLVAAVPALAQEGQAAATGVLVDGLPQDVGGFGTHSISDEATGTLYALRSAGADLDSYAGQRVTVYGALTPGEDGSGEGDFGAGGTLPSIDVTRIEPAGDPADDGEITATFELAVEGEPPTGTAFFAGASQQVAALEDPDGDGTYEGALTLPEGFYDLGPFPVPVAMLAGTPEVPNQQTIEYFGEVVLEDGDHFSADYSFDGPAPGSSATFAYELAVDCEPPEGAEFLGLTATESLVTTPLTDPDGDGVYTGSQTVPRFAPGGPGEPIEISPVRIVQGPPTATGPLGPEYRVIEDFGAVTAEDRTLSASVSFCDGGGPDGGGTTGGPVVSGDTGGIVPSLPKVLPSTGGLLPIACLVGLVLVAGGLMNRRRNR